jgi:hypothetical protein
MEIVLNFHPIENDRFSIDSVKKWRRKRVPFLSMPPGVEAVKSILEGMGEQGCLKRARADGRRNCN